MADLPYDRGPLYDILLAVKTLLVAVYGSSYVSINDFWESEQVQWIVAHIDEDERIDDDAMGPVETRRFTLRIEARRKSYSAVNLLYWDARRIEEKLYQNPTLNGFVKGLKVLRRDFQWSGELEQRSGRLIQTWIGYYRVNGADQSNYA